MNLCIIQISLFHGSSIYYSRATIICSRFRFYGKANGGQPEQKKFLLDIKADIMFNCSEEIDQLSSDSIELIGLLLGEDVSVHLII